MGNSLDYARREFDILLDSMRAEGRDEREIEMQASLQQGVLDALQVLEGQGHSGSSISYTVSLLTKLAMYEPITALQGTDDEWNEISDRSWGPKFQNKRCGHVFKDADGQAYDSNGRIFVDGRGCTYTSKGSRTPVTFPYWPKRVYSPSRDDLPRFERAEICAIADYSNAQEVRDLYERMQGWEIDNGIPPPPHEAESPEQMNTGDAQVATLEKTEQ